MQSASYLHAASIFPPRPVDHPLGRGFFSAGFCPVRGITCSHGARSAV